MTAFIAKLVIKPEMKEQFEKAQTELRELTYLNEPETPVYELLKSRDNPEVYFCVATFNDEAAFDYHMSTDFHDRLVPEIVESQAEEITLHKFEYITPAKIPRDEEKKKAK